MDVIAGNVLNINTTRNAAGEAVPYRRRFAVLQAGNAADPSQPGVHVAEVALDQTPFNERFDPGHPDADPATGMVKTPNVDLAVEHVNLLQASRAYEANVTLMQTSKAMFNSAIRLLA